MSRFLELPLVDGGTTVLSRDDRPRRMKPHPHKPLVRLTFEDGVELHVQIQWRDLAEWLGLAVDSVGNDGKIVRAIDTIAGTVASAVPAIVEAAPVVEAILPRATPVVEAVEAAAPAAEAIASAVPGVPYQP